MRGELGQGFSQWLFSATRQLSGTFDSPGRQWTRSKFSLSMFRRYCLTQILVVLCGMIGSGAFSLSKFCLVLLQLDRIVHIKYPLGYLRHACLENELQANFAVKK